MFSKHRPTLIPPPQLFYILIMSCIQEFRDYVQSTLLCGLRPSTIIVCHINPPNINHMHEPPISTLSGFCAQPSPLPNWRQLFYNFVIPATFGLPVFFSYCMCGIPKWNTVHSQITITYYLIPGNLSHDRL